MTLPSSAVPSRSFCAKVVTVLLVVSLLSTSVFAAPEAPKVLLVSLNEIKNDIRYAVGARTFGFKRCRLLYATPVSWMIFF